MPHGTIENRSKKCFYYRPLSPIKNTQLVYLKGRRSLYGYVKTNFTENIGLFIKFDLDCISFKTGHHLSLYNKVDFFFK